MKKIAILVIISFFTIMSCQQSKMKFELSDSKFLKDIPGASGLAYNDKYIMVIGDNSPYLYLLDHDAKPVSQHIIYPIDDFIDGEIIKSLKPDFEAMELISGESYDELLIFGSGSKSPLRDVFIHVTLSEEPVITSYSLLTFYDQIRSLEIMKGSELNIEAVAHYDNKLLLFNRGKNLILEFNYIEFLQFLKEEIPFPTPSVTEFNLPHIGGFSSGFSGATIIPNTKTLLFTTSVEDTPNAYDDGEVLGSFIGMIDLDHLDGEIEYVKITDQGQAMKVKVESIAVKNKTSPNELEIIMVTDSDGDESLLLKGFLKW